MPKNFMAIADDYLGNYLALTSKSDEIYFIDHELDPARQHPQLVASDIFELLKKLKESGV